MNELQQLCEPGSGIAAAVGVCLAILINYLFSGKDHA